MARESKSKSDMPDVKLVATVQQRLNIEHLWTQNRAKTDPTL